MPQDGQTKPQPVATAAMSGMLALCLLSASPVMAAGLDLPDRAHTDTILPLGDKLWLGFGLSSPYIGEAGNDAQAMAPGSLATPSASQGATSLSSTLGWQLSEQWSLGVGLDILHGEPAMSHAVTVPLAAEGASDAANELPRLSADNWETGYKLGMQFAPSVQTRLDWQYRSAMSRSLSGDEALSYPAGQGVKVDPYQSRTDLTLPAITSLGFTHQADPRWTLLGQYNWVEWSRLDEQNIALSDGSYTRIDQDYRDSWSLSLGSEFRYDPQWTLRGGLQYSQTPAPKLMGDSTRLALGAAYRSNERLSVEMAYTHVLIKQQSLAMDRDYYQGLSDSDVSMRGRSSGNAHIFGLGLRYAF